MPKSPTLETLQAAAAAVADDPAFRALGNIDCAVGLCVGKQAFVLDFSAFECSGIRAADARDLDDADFVIDMDSARWRRYFGDRAKGKTTLASFALDNGAVRARNPLARLGFDRYHLSLQAFLDHAAAA